MRKKIVLSLCMRVIEHKKTKIKYPVNDAMYALSTGTGGVPQSTEKTPPINITRVSQIV